MKYAIITEYLKLCLSEVVSKFRFYKIAKIIGGNKKIY